MSSFIERHSLSINILFNLGLLLLCAISYLLLLLLFLTPQILRVKSLAVVNDDFLKPTVAVGLLSALLSGATSALITRCVEHSLWLRIEDQSGSGSGLCARESHRLAQWSVSPLARIYYLFHGASLLLRFSGIALLATAVINPILLFGISPAQDTSASTRVIEPTTANKFDGFIDRSNSQYNGGRFRDTLMSLSGQAQMSNVSVPSSSLCTQPTCSISALAPAMFAACKYAQMDNPNRIGTRPGPVQNMTLCSTDNPNLCVVLVKGDPDTFVNFTAGNPPDCFTACKGDWADIMGAWVNSIDTPLNADLPINLVQCRISFGNVTITQNGSAPPRLDRSTFTKSVYTASEYGVSQWHRIYSQTDGNCSPYVFSGQSGGASGGSTLTESPFGVLLVNYATGASGDAETVARRIEANFDAASLFAFARRPQATRVTIRTTSSQSLWRYDWRVLLVLLVPFFAKVSVLCTRWRIGSDEVVIGYDPVEISRRGLIQLVDDHNDYRYVENVNVRTK